MQLGNRISYYQQRHRLTIPQIAELREFSGKKIQAPADRQMKLSSMAKVAELIRLSKLFKANNLDFISIKGPLLSWRLHHDFTVRYSNDLDILVQSEDISRVTELLKKDGYQAHIFDLPQTRNKQRMVLKINNQIIFMHPQKNITLEVHWRLIRPEIISKTRMDQLLQQNTESFKFNDEEFTVLNKESELVFLIFHGAMHQWFRLKWLHDIFAYSKDAELNWEKVFTISKIFNGEHLVYQSIQLADRYWVLPHNIASMYTDNGIRLNPLLLEYPLKSIAINELEPKPGLMNWAKYIYEKRKYGLLLFSTARYKYTFIRRLFLRDVELDKLNLPDFLTFLYLPLRPVLLVYSKLFPSGIHFRNSK